MLRPDIDSAVSDIITIARRLHFQVLSSHQSAGCDKAEAVMYDSNARYNALNTAVGLYRELSKPEMFAAHEFVCRMASGDAVVAVRFVGQPAPAESSAEPAPAPESGDSYLDEAI